MPYPMLHKPGQALILRTCKADLTSYEGFQWPASGPVSAPDWNPEVSCGLGLHGFSSGEGDGSLINWSHDATWLVVAVDPATLVNLRGKVKYPAGEVLDLPKDRVTATGYLREHCCGSRAIVGLIFIGGDNSTITGGYGSTIAGGDDSTIAGSYRSTITAGNDSTITGDNELTITSGYRSTITSGHLSTITAGYRSIITSGYCSTIVAGDGSIITAGDKSFFLFRNVPVIGFLAGQVGQNGLRPDVAYRVVNGVIVPA